ncbi:MAG: tetratricopeptide repeat protein [Candidatus Krumholzibacteria bacterium]|nr:tetratricopeptide repeat protein [Candidatus Krumholzibacteria bacterium]
MAAARISKRKLKEDTFIATTLKAWEYVRDNEKRFFIGLVAVVCIAAVAGWAAYARKQSGIKASSYFADALASFRTGDLKTSQDMFTLIAREHGGTEEGAYSSYFLGKCLLETGKYPEAIEAFDRYLSKSARHPFFRDAAMEGKAVSLENEHRYKDAGDAYLELARNLKTNHFMETSYLRSAAENFRNANETEKAIEVLGILLEKAKGTERRDIEIEMEMIRG